MIEEIPRTSSFAHDLAMNFDRAFAEPPRGEKPPVEGFLALRVGGDGYAVHVGEVAQVLTGRPIMPLPSPVSDLLGLVGYRSAIVPVYGLRSLLGYERGASPRSMVLIEKPARLMLAFDQFETYLQVPRESVMTADCSAEHRPHVREVIRAPQGPRAVVSIPSLVAQISARTTGVA